MAALIIRPELWLLASRSIVDSIERAWLPALPPDSLLGLRLRCGLIRPCAPQDWRREIGTARSQGLGTLHFVAEQMDESTWDRFETLAGLDPDLRGHAWRPGGAIDIVQSASCPDEDYLAAWREHRLRPSVWVFPAGLHPDWTVAAYERAVQTWELLARSLEPDEMAELYDPQRGLVQWLQQPDALRNVKEAEASFELTAVGATLANEWPVGWLTKDGTTKLELRPTEDKSSLHVRIVIDCPGSVAANLKEVSLCLADTLWVSLGGGAGLDWKESDGKVYAAVDVTIDPEQRAAIAPDSTASVRLRRVN